MGAACQPRTCKSHGEYLPSGRSAYRTSERNRYRFIGVERDVDTGLCMTGPRTYDPLLGRFLQPDPLVQAGEGPFVYASGNPVGRLDPGGYNDEPSASLPKPNQDLVVPLQSRVDVAFDQPSDIIRRLEVNGSGDSKISELSGLTERLQAGTFQSRSVKTDRWAAFGETKQTRDAARGAQLGFAASGNSRSYSALSKYEILATFADGLTMRPLELRKSDQRVRRYRDDKVHYFSVNASVTATSSQGPRKQRENLKPEMLRPNVLALMDYPRYDGDTAPGSLEVVGHWQVRIDVYNRQGIHVDTRSIHYSVRVNVDRESPQTGESQFMVTEVY